MPRRPSKQARALLVRAEAAAGSVALDMIALRSAAAVGRWPSCVALYALTSSAAAPVACGAAIEVPLNIE